MTCIVAIEHSGDVYVGGDSAGVSGWSLTVRADEKVFATGPFVMGFTSSFRMGQLLQFRLNAPPQECADDFEYMATVFIDAVRHTLKTGGYVSVENGREEGGQFLVGYRGRVYRVDSDFQVGRPADGFAAVGCGSDIALGALYASAHLPPDARIETALDAAERFSAGVRGPFVVLANRRPAS